MAKVVIEFDPSIPEELEAVVKLFHSMPDSSASRVSSTPVTTLLPKRRGRPPKSESVSAHESQPYHTNEWSSADISTERDSSGKTKHCQQCGMYVWKKYEHRRSTSNPDLCDSCGGDAVREADFSDVPAINPSKEGVK